ncbi:hypothetical protein WJX75_002712 [Coccomyxa subellipsoidea]|uniref:DNA glycosylase n=1 Tax=Coccomyxa subellipsoidea TaxID=248742 RepID=A0ABR2YR38_9CHLO
MEEGEVHPMTLEWLRDVAEDNARQYLMGVMGLGRKSVACVMLLALCKHDFPVDTNVGRICARLGWIPLDAEEALEDLDRYAPEPEVHKYLHSRLMHFDLDTLYELHYQMITLGKVFCSKRNPNCSACPLRPQSMRRRPVLRQQTSQRDHARHVLTGGQILPERSAKAFLRL